MIFYEKGRKPLDHGTLVSGDWKWMNEIIQTSHVRGVRLKAIVGYRSQVHTKTRTRLDGRLVEVNQVPA